MQMNCVPIDLTSSITEIISTYEHIKLNGMVLVERPVIIPGFIL